MALPRPTRRDTGTSLSSAAALSSGLPRLTPMARGARSLCLGLVLAAGTTAMAQQAASPVGAVRANYDIPAGPLGPALSRFAASAGITLSFEPALTEGRQTAGLHGSHALSEGFAQLLAGSGLEAVARVGGGYTLRRSATAAARADGTAGATTLDEVRVTADAERSNTSEGTGSYAARASTTATGLNLSLRETPQSISVVTRQRMDDEAIESVSDVLQRSTGVAVNALDSERLNAYSRGFSLSNYQIDGQPTWYSVVYGTGITLSDMVIYDRVEVVRGAAGLLAGAGDPSGTVNLVRKRPTADFAGYVSGSLGSWDNRRGEVDVSGPLNAAGTLRGRFVSAWQDTNSYRDRYSNEKQIAYGVVEADIAPDTLLTVGLDYQKNKPKGVSFSGLPLFRYDGSEVAYARSASSGGAGSTWNQDARTLFASVDHGFGQGWKGRLAYSNYLTQRDGTRISASWGPVQQDGSVQLYGGYGEGRSEQNSIDARLSGPFELFGRQHQLLVGLNASKATDRITSYSNANYGLTEGQRITGSILDWDGSYPAVVPTTVHSGVAQETKQTGIYASGRFSLTDSLSLVLGNRISSIDYDYLWTSYAARTSQAQNYRRHGESTPYAGIVYDLNPNWSVYASYTSIFKQQQYKDRNNRLLDATSGVNYELGTKATFLEGKLNASFAVFRIEQDRLPVRDNGYSASLPDGSRAYVSVDGATTRGAEVELSGEIAPRWQAYASYSHSRTEDRTGLSLTTEAPENLVKLGTSYRFSGALSGLTVGGNLYWQSDTYFTSAWPVVGTARQDAYTLVGLMARYQINRQTSVSVNVDNLFDKKYHGIDPTFNTKLYGAPRSVLVTAKYTF
jgi:outer membrane receptor for ferric coprogen and ferric-rhodotorulic acid